MPWPMRDGPASSYRPKRSGSLLLAAGSTEPSLLGARSSRPVAGRWQGAFPHENLKLDRYERTSPVTAFPPNAYGVYDMIGNVWSGPSTGNQPGNKRGANKAGLF